MGLVIRSLYLVIFSFIFYFLYSIFYIPAFAQQEFTVSYDTTYSIRTDGAADVIQEITLTNNFSTIYATSYSLFLEGKIPEDIGASQNIEELPVEIQEEGERTKITVNFPKAIVGKGKSRIFEVRYKFPDTAIQNGQVWDLTIPKLASPETINSYRLTLKVPKSFGGTAYISPEPRARGQEGDLQSFAFEKEDLTRAGVVAAFGESQVFSLSLTYHLKNPYSQKGETEIALPPDTAFQRVYYSQLSPAPLKIRIDTDGNFMAVYKIEGKQSLDIFLNGAVQIFSKPQEFYPKATPENSTNLSENEYWQTNDPEIKRIANTLKTPRAIYDFVVNKLSYDYSRVREGVSRLGAKEALNNPGSAICMEFTDLFVALARAAGIPAREINGYAYTENPEIQPLSLVADVLHAWPEYWNDDLEAWKPVDPTWGNTTGGIDFFDKFDLAHITFAIHGKDPNYPLTAGSYKIAESPQKDVRVEFGKLPESREPKPEIKAEFKKSFFPRLGTPLTSGNLEIKITNVGPASLYKGQLLVRSETLSNSAEIPFLAPFDSTTIAFPVRIPFFKTANYENAVITIGDSVVVYNIDLGQIRLVWFSVLFLSLLLAPVLLFLGIKRKKLLLNFRAIWQKRF